MRINSKGLLFVSQVRLTSRTIKARLDADFRLTVLAKLANVFEIANRKDLSVVFIGNLFEKPRDVDAVILSGLLSLIAKAAHKPIILANAEELNSKDELLNDVTLSIIEATQLATIITKTGVAATLDVEGQAVDLWAAPYGGIEGVTFERPTICMTHDVMNSPCDAINNVGQVVNGYSTGVGRMVDFGGTNWLFPESLSRLTIEEQGNLPSAWAWTQVDGIKRHLIDYKEVAFSDAEDIATESIAALPASLFAALLKEDLDDELEIDDSVVFKADIELLMAEQEVKEPVRLMLLDLIRRAAKV